jgi:hypothetical protein
MSKFQKLAQINKIANECVQDGDFVLASKFHNKFMKIAQLDLDQPEQPALQLDAPEIQFIGALHKCPNFLSTIANAPALGGRTDIPTYRPDASAATVRLVQELLGMSADGAVGQKTLLAMRNLLNSGKLDQMLTRGFKNKFKIK